VTLHVSNPTTSPTEELFIGSNTVEPMGLTRLIPDPVLTKILPNGLMMTVAVPPGTQDAEFRLMLTPVGIGPIVQTARLNDRLVLRWQQIVLP
jgi:hypothetical protein